MLRFLATGSLLLQIVSSPLASAGEENGAQLYMQACSGLRSLTAEEDALLKAAFRPSDPSSAATVREREIAQLLEDFAAPLDLFVQASQAKESAWPPPDPENRALRALAKHYVTLQRLTLLRAGQRLRHQHAEQSLVDLQAALTAARRPPPYGVGLILQCSMENHWINLVSRHLADCDAATLQSLLPLTSPFSLWSGLPAFFESEQRLLFRMLERGLSRRKSSASDAWLPFASKLPETVIRRLTLRQANRKMKEYRDAAFAIVRLPPPEALAKVDDFKARLKSEEANRLNLTFLAPPIEVAKVVVALDIRRAMLRTAINIRLQGPEAVSTSSDPFTGKPFIYEKVDNGFLLTSEFSYKEKPVSLLIPEKP